MSEFYLESVGVLGPGLPDWQTARRVLGGELPHRAEIQPQPNPLQLPPNERRAAYRNYQGCCQILPGGWHVLVHKY